MRLIILMGGKGTRLLPLTKYHPKVMSSIHGRPFLYYLLNLYKKHDIVLGIGYMGDVIKRWCKENDIWPEYVEEQEPMGHAGAILYAKPFIENSRIFGVVNGDTYHDVDLNKAKIELSKDKKALALKIYATNKLNGNVEGCGVYVLKIKALTYFKKGIHTDEILNCIPLHNLYLPNNYFVDIGSHEGLKYAKESNFIKDLI